MAELFKKMRVPRRDRLKWQLGWGCCVFLYGLVIASTEVPKAEQIPTMEVSQHDNSILSEPVEHLMIPGAATLSINCTPPAIEHFPRPFLSPYIRKHGGILMYIVICLYAFIGLAIVCEDYFVVSVDRICEDFSMTPDVAGATFLAAGSSVPELVTVVVGVFIAKDDIGVSGVIGSAVFNIMFVISVCALFAGTTSYLNWWPLCRDCFFYTISIFTVLLAIADEKIYWKESLAMLICYVAYCLTLCYNTSLKAWVLGWSGMPANYIKEKEQLVTYKTNGNQERKYSAVQFSSGVEKFNSEYESIPDKPHPGPVSRFEIYKSKEYDPEKITPLNSPKNGDLFSRIRWGLCFPVHFACFFTIPDCRFEHYRAWYPLTFINSIFWISFYSYIVIWMITVIGNTLGIPDTVMGLTFVAIGVSVPDALSSLAVLKEGHVDMAVSMAVGSNVFDMLLGLGVPWFIQTAIINPGGFVNVYSKGLTYSTVSLLSTVAFLLVVTYINDWVMDKIYGFILMAWYFLFIGFASLCELNVFGYVNPPECVSDF